ncbi:MAG: AAA domain-containing protein, partial [Cyclobacteriaceae bacterium]
MIDEASQCDIASALPLLYRAKRAVIIGDDKQLTHISSISETQDIHLLEKYGLDDNYMG